MTDTTKRYRLKKDYVTPRFTYAKGADVAYLGGMYVIGIETFTEEALKSTPDWFEEVLVSEPVKEMVGVTVTEMNTYNSRVHYGYSFNVHSVDIDCGKIKQAIESALNDTVDLEMYKLVRDNEALKSLNEQLCSHIDSLNKKIQTPLNDTVLEDKNMSTVYFDKQVLNPHAQGTQAYTNWEQGFMEAANKYFKPQLQSEVDAIRADTWEAARSLTMTDFHHTPYAYRAFSDYLSSLNLNSNDTGKEDNETKSANWRSENLSKQSAPEPSALPNKEWKEWKIVDIMDDNGQIISNPSTDIIHMVLKHRGERIHSVRRESDKEIFTIGDKISWGCTGVYETTLTTFEIKNNRLKFYYDKLPENSNPCDFLDAINLYKLPTPTQPVLFTTEDGVEIKDRVTDYYAVRDFKRSGRCNGMAWYHPETGEKYFSTPEAAEQYILENKKLFSLQEIKQYVGIYSSDFCLEKFELSAKLKLNK